MSDPVAFRFRFALDDLRDAMLRAPEIIVEELAPAVMQSSLLAQKEIQDRTPTSGAGTLRESIGAYPVSFAKNVITGSVGTASPYAVPVELGTKPHMPPVKPLSVWVHEKLGKSWEEAEEIAQKIAWKIKHHGTAGAHMFEEGFAHVEPQIREILEAAFTQAIERIGDE